MYLMFVGAFATCVAQAAWRRDPRWALAFAMPLLLSGECAGLPASLVAWGLLAWGAAAAAFLLAAVARAIEMRPAFAIGLVGAVGLVIAPASAERQIRAASLHRPPLAGLAAERLLRTLIASQP